MHFIAFDNKTEKKENYVAGVLIKNKFSVTVKSICQGGEKCALFYNSVLISHPSKTNIILTGGFKNVENRHSGTRSPGHVGFILVINIQRQIHFNFQK